MTWLIAVSLAISVSMTVLLVMQLLPGQPRAVRQRLADVEALGGDPHSILQKRRRQRQRERIIDILMALGTRLQGLEGGKANSYTEFLRHAGYRHPSAVAIFWGIRLVLALTLGFGMFVLLPLMGRGPFLTTVGAFYFGSMGYVLPVLVLRSRKNARQKEIQKALADALDLLVVCVEAGLGLNQALLRVSQEIKHVSMTLAAEMGIVNVEIRAGVPRETALRNLADRTGVEDIRSLVTMLIQTDRFGTSVARSLRVHSDTLRMKRRQRAEEAAAKTAIKMVFPLVFCIFPALFVVIIGPGLMLIFNSLGGL